MTRNGHFACNVRAVRNAGLAQLCQINACSEPPVVDFFLLKKTSSINAEVRRLRRDKKENAVPVIVHFMLRAVKNYKGNADEQEIHGSS